MLLLANNNTGLHCTMFKCKLKRPFFFLLVLFPPLCAAVDMTFCKGCLDQIQAMTFKRQNSTSPAGRCHSSASVSHGCHRDTRKNNTTNSWPRHLGKWLRMPWVTVTLQMHGSQAPQGQTQPQTSRWSMCLHALYWDQGDGGKNIQRITVSLNH